MNSFTPINEPQTDRLPKPKPSRRSFGKALMMWVRRAHLYLGLFLLPWAILYGVSAFLFNHPTAFGEQPTVTFGNDALAGTPLETPPEPQLIAEQALAKLNELQQPAKPYVLAGPAKFTGREFAFATVKAEGQTVNVLIDVKHGGGTVRSAPNRERKEPVKAPFAVGGSAGRGTRGPGGQGGRGVPKGDGGNRSSDGLRLDDSLPDRVKVAVPLILERTGFPAGEVTVTSVPDITFPVEADGREWIATFGPMTGALSGQPTEDQEKTELGWRRFLLRLHTAHGYPGEANGKWFWAVIVDVMAFTMCFWGLSGLFMWWPIKATRNLGAVVLAMSAIAATGLGVAMYALMTA